MRMLGIETSCDETSAAVVTDTDGTWTIGSNIVASQVAIHREWGGIVPEIASRQHIRDICGVVRSALDTAKTELTEHRCDRRHARARPRGIPARRRLVCEVPRGFAGSSAGGRASSCGSYRVAVPAARRSAAAARRARRVRRAHQLVSREGAWRRTRASAGRGMTRRERRTTRSRGCLASAIRAGRSWTSARATETIRRSRCRWRA